jgi:hypothetical protein
MYPPSPTVTMNNLFECHQAFQWLALVYLE